MRTTKLWQGVAICLFLLASGGRGLSQEAPRPGPAPAGEPARSENGEAPEPEEPEEPEEEEEDPWEDPIETDRDSFTPSTRPVGQGRLVMESAYSFIDNRVGAETHSFPELLFRFGMTDRLELRLGWNYEIGGGGNSVAGSTEGSDGLEDLLGLEGGGVEEESRVFYGFKAQVTDQYTLLPVSSVIVQGFTPTSGEANDSQVVATYVFGWELPGRSKLDAAMRYGTGSEEEDHFNVWAPSVVWKVPVGRRIDVHAEYFGLFSQGKEQDFVQHFVSPGVHVLLTPDVEVGVRVGWGLNEQTPRFFSNVGLGVRF
jgi:hypothetical protein